MNCHVLSIKLDLPAGLEGMDSFAFANCYVIEEVFIQDSITRLGGAVLSNCVNFCRLCLPDNLSGIPECFVYGCRNLSSVNIPDHVTMIGHTAFRNSGITELYLPAGVQSMDWDSLYGMKKLKRLVNSDTYASVRCMCLSPKT